MLYVNDELLKRDSPQWKKYDQFRKEVISKMKNPVIFKSSKPILFNTTGGVEPPALEMIPLDYTIVTEEGEEHWRVAKRPPRKDSNGNLKWDAESRRRILKRAWILDKNKDHELIFFLMNVSSFVKNGKIYYYDKQLEAQKDLQQEVGELDVRFMILSEKSPISFSSTGNEDTLRMLSASWGIANAHDREELSLEEIKLKLWSAVQSSQKDYQGTKRGFNEFMKEVESTKLSEVRANTQRAIDEGIVLYDDQNFAWRFATSNTLLMQVPASVASDPRKALMEFLVMNHKAAQVVKMALENPYNADDVEVEKVEDLNKLTPEQVKELHWGDLKTLAVSLGINTFQKKKPELTDLVLSMLS
jgi:hypothetical protein